MRTRTAIRPSRFSLGYTLIEVMITLVIIAILVAIAYPSYGAFVRKSRRNDAVTSLARIQMAQEKYRSNNANYGTLEQLGGPNTSTDGYYVLAIENNTAAGYSATAIPIAGKTQVADSPCPVISLTVNAGNAVYGPSASCWGK